MEASPRVVNIGLEALDGVDLFEDFHEAHTWGAYSGDVQFVFNVPNLVQKERSWKLFFFILRSLVFRPGKRYRPLLKDR